jgi:hypothetical protein
LGVDVPLATDNLTDRLGKDLKRCQEDEDLILRNLSTVCYMKFGLKMSTHFETNSYSY